MKRVAIVHTSFVFINVELTLLDLFGELLPDVELVHFVDGELLDRVIDEGRISDKSVSRMRHLVGAAEDADADVVFSACSSLGPAIETVRRDASTPVLRIDDAMAEAAVAQASSIGVLATVPTTLAPTVDLIRSKAENLGKEVRIEQELNDGGFQVLMSGDRDRHDEIVTESAERLAERCDLIVLAQASMARLGPRLAAATNLEVLSSPRLGVQAVKDIVSGLSAEPIAGNERRSAG